MQDYVTALRSQGKKAVLGPDRSCWEQNEMFGMQRVPPHCLRVPQPGEVRRLLWKTRSLVASYVLAADDAHPANARLYVCENRDYCVDQLAPPVRRHIRRALGALCFRFLAAEEFLQHGVRPYCDTRARAGLSDGTPELFREHAVSRAGNPACQILGAWHGDVLAAYMWMLMIDDWVAIAAYAADEHLHLRPNNGLVHFALDYCLTQRRCRVVCYGLSSLQEVSRAATLDTFKRKVGFETRPVNRVLLFHPLVKPFLNSLTLKSLHLLLRIRPRSRLLRKAAGVIAGVSESGDSFAGPEETANALK